MAWQRVAVVVEGRHAAPLADALEAAGAISTEIADAQAGGPGERALFGEPGAEARLWPLCRITALFALEDEVGRALDEALEACGEPHLRAASVDRLEDADWVAETQRQFDPVQAGERLWIVPSWHAPPRPDAINIELDPGAAFGTGSHPTTRLCLRWLERNVRAGDTVLDYGCGSGILGIAALKLGASRALGVDIDPLALQAASYNAGRNHVALEVASAQDAVVLTARLTVANILANPLKVLAPLLCTQTAIGGFVALSGILEEQATDVARAYRPYADLEVDSREAGWILLSGERRT